MDDLISRQAAIDVLKMDISIIPFAKAREYVQAAIETIYNRLEELPSAQRNVSERNVGEWEMFELITSTWYGKQCYFVEENGIVYSRVSCKYMSVDEAIKEFLGRIGDNG